ncbi:MAG: YlxR family protein [Candidatus Eremiobacteraeota bacterium]|nr:YlxR family protein [Candidatus Eremiobacteraeota bacterium]
MKAEPVRQCVGCRKRLPQHAMVRWVRGSGLWKADASGRHKQAGRGAYICSAECLPAAAKNKRYPGLATAAAEYGLISSSKNMKNDV